MVYDGSQGKKNNKGVPMRYLGIVGIGLVLWGLFTFDWLLAGVGALFLLVSFIRDVFKKRGSMTDDKVFAIYKVLHQLIRIIRTGVEESDTALRNPKLKLAQGLFFLGMIDAASQASDMSDGQFLDLFKAVFTDFDYDFDENFQSKLLLFHQELATEHVAFPAIMKGGDLYTKFAQGNTATPLVGASLIKELVEDSSFPNSIEDL